MLEGNTIDTYWRWEETLGPLKNRPGVAGVWEYQLTTGLGLIEYMEWCDDLELEPSKFNISVLVHGPRRSTDTCLRHH